MKASLNHIFRTIWSEALGTWVAVSELTPSKGKSGSCVLNAAELADGKNNAGNLDKPNCRLRFKPLAITLACCFSFGAQANPIDAQVVNGTASISQSGSVLTITNSPNAIINWQSFSINAGETTRFIQESASSSVLNRVLGADPSRLLGTLTSNGRVFLINPAGILVGQGARIDVPGFVASTLPITNADFLAGRLNFSSSPFTPIAGTIQNNGTITTPEGGSVYLIAPQVENNGIISTPKGETILAAGNTVQLMDTGTPGVTVQVTGSGNAATNLGQILADSGRIGMVGAVVRNSGTINASSLVSQGGKIFLRASNRVEAGGTITANGTTGGAIEVLGKETGVMDGATLSANGAQGGGTVLIGGDYQGKNSTVQNAQVSYVASTASISADATANGNGGKVIVWADDTTRAYGSISAKGGTQGGNGGFIETSAHHLDVTGIRIDAAAPNGKSGSWLLDPINVTIAATADAGGALATGIWTPTLTGSTITAATIQTALNAGTSVTITTTGGLAEAGDINVNTNIAKTAGGAATLTMQAANNITVAAGMGITSTAGALNVVLDSDSDASGAGAILLNTGSSISSLGGNITLGGGADPSVGYAFGNATYEQGIKISAGSSLNSAGGNISIRGEGWQGGGGAFPWGVQTVAGCTIDSGAGTILIDGIANVGANSIGASVGGIITSSNTTASAITINGLVRPGGSTDTAIGLNMLGTVQATNGGGITLNGTGGTTAGQYSEGINLSGADILSTGGAITLTGNDPTNGADIQMWGNVFIGQKAGSSVTSSSSNITLNADTLLLTATDRLQSSGALTIKPRTAGGTIGIEGGAGTLQLLASYFSTNFVNGFSGITIGGVTAGDITANGFTFRDNLTLWAGNPDAAAVLSGTIANAGSGASSGSLTVKAAGDISTSAAITTQNQAVLFNSDSDATNGGAIHVLNSASISSNGGAIMLAGGLSGAGFAKGQTGNPAYGIDFGSNITLSSVGGDITMRGESFTGQETAGFSMGIYTPSGANNTFDSGAGKISLTGVSKGAGNTNAQGLGINDGTTFTSSSTAADAITLTGEYSGTGSTNIGLGVNMFGTALATNGGGIAIIGTGGPLTAGTNSMGIHFRGTLLANSGPITLTGTRGPTANGSVDIQTFAGSVIGQMAATAIPASTSNITINGDTVSFAGTLHSGGNVTINVGSNLSLTDAQVQSGGNMTVNVGGNLSLTASTAWTALQSTGTQTINFTGSGVAHLMTVHGGDNSSYSGAAASVESTGLQTINYATTGGSTLDILVAGGSGLNNSQNAYVYTNNVQGAQICATCATFNWAGIRSDGGQTITASTINVNGGAGAGNTAAGNGNYANIQNKSTTVAQDITTTGAIYINGGTAPGVYNASYPNDGVGNDASINSDGAQIIHAGGAISLAGGGDANTLGGAFLSSKVSQDITTVGSLIMTGGLSNTGGQYGIGAAAVIGEQYGANITLTIGGNLTMVGGTGSASGALIGSAEGTPNIDITAAAISMASGGGGTPSHSQIGVLMGGPTGALSMTATTGNITQDQYSSINTASLTAIANAGAINFAGANLVSAITSLSASGNISYVNVGNIGLGLLTAAGTVSVTSTTGAILDNNGTGVNNITASSITLTSNNGGASGQLAISADTQVAYGGSIAANISGGSYGGIRIDNTGATTAAADAPGLVSLSDNSAYGGAISFMHHGDISSVNTTGISAATNHGDIFIGVDGNLTAGNGFITISTPGSALIGTTGGMVIGSIANAVGSLALAGTSLDISGNVSAGAGDLTLLAPTVNITGGTANASQNAYVFTNNLTVTDGSVAAAVDTWVAATGDVRINATTNASISAGRDVTLTLAGPASTLYFNEPTAGNLYTGTAKVQSGAANLPATVYLDFLGRSSGGVLIDGVETLTTAAAGRATTSGFYNAGTPAVDGAGLQVTYLIQNLSNTITALLPPPASTPPPPPPPLPPPPQSGGTMPTLLGPTDATVGGTTGTFGGTDTGAGGSSSGDTQPANGPSGAGQSDSGNGSANADDKGKDDSKTEDSAKKDDENGKGKDDNKGKSNAKPEKC